MCIRDRFWGQWIAPLRQILCAFNTIHADSGDVESWSTVDHDQMKFQSVISETNQFKRFLDLLQNIRVISWDCQCDDCDHTNIFASFDIFAFYVIFLIVWGLDGACIGREVSRILSVKSPVRCPGRENLIKHFKFFQSLLTPTYQILSKTLNARFKFVRETLKLHPNLITFYSSTST